MISHSELYFIFYVKDQQKARDLYAGLFLLEPSLDVPGMTEFIIGDKIKLGLMPSKNVHRIFETPVKHPDEAEGIPKCELYLVVENPEEYFQRGIELGFTVLSEIKKRNWEHSAGYLMDKDGNVIVFAKQD